MESAYQLEVIAKIGLPWLGAFADADDLEELNARFVAKRLLDCCDVKAAVFNCEFPENFVSHDF